MSHKKTKPHHPPPPSTPTTSAWRKTALTTLSLSLLIPSPAVFAQYKYKAYVKDLLATGTTIPDPDPLTTPGQLIITPTSFEFANTPKNSTSEAVFTAKNTSPTSSPSSLITLGNPSLSNTDAFSYIATCPPILAPQASCQIRVLFKPPSPSTYSTSLSFPSANATAPLPSSSISGQGINSVITFSANPLSFPDTDTGASSPSQTLSISNAGSTTLTISSLSTTAPFSISSHTCGDFLNPSQSCTATLTFSPTTVGPNSSLFSFNTSSQSFTTELSGIGLGPVITLSPSAISASTTLDTSTPLSGQSLPSTFSPLALNTPTDPNLNYKKLTSTSTLTNSGTKPLTNLSLSYSSSSTASPYISTTCASTLPAGSSCTVSLSTYRHLKNKHTGFLTISGSSVSPKQLPVSLEIASTPPTNAVSSDSTSHDFGPVVVRQPSSPKRITFSYSGTSSATVNTPPNPLLSLSNNTCTNATLSHGDSCSVDVSLTPTSPRPNLFTIWAPTYTLSTSSSPTPIIHQFTYSGLGESLSLSPSISSSTTTSSPSSSTYTLSNSGNRPSSLSFSHSSLSPSYTLSPSSPCSTIQPGSSCSLTAIAASNTEGLHTGTLTILGSTSSPTFPTSLTVSDAPNLTLSSTNLPFGTVAPYSTTTPQADILSNIGASPAILGSLSTSSPFTLSHNCPSSLPALSTCTLSFNIDTAIPAPPETTPISSSLTLSQGQPYSKSINLSAILLGSIANDLGDITLSPPSASFPYTPPGQQSLPKTFTISNNNSSPADPLLLTPLLLGSDSSQFSVSPDSCSAPINPGSSCSFSVSYSPSSSLSTPQNTIVAASYNGAIIGTSTLIASDIPVNSLTFNPLNFNTSNPTTSPNIQPFFYKNTSANPLTITPSFSIGSRFSTLSNTCSSVQPNSTCKITVHAKTDTEGSFQDSMNVNGTLVSLNSFVFPFPSLNFSQYGNTITSLNYGTVSHKKPLSTSNVQLNNASSSPATLSPINFFSLSGISQSNDCSGTTATTGTLCNFSIDVAPTTIASPLNADSYNWSSTLRVSTSDGLSSAALPIKGTAVVGTHSLPSSINFGTFYLGESSTQPLTITNSSTNLAEISTTAVSTGASDITHSTPCLNTWFGPGQTCTSTLTFTPTSPGTRSGNITLGVIGKSNQSRSVPWTANVVTGFNTETLLSPNSWAPNTTVGTPITQLITFTNTYYQPLTIANPSYSSGFPAGLTITSNTCSGQTIQPQATCTMTLRFSSATAFEKATSSTINFPLSPVNQSVSISIPSAYASLGDPAITSLKEASYPAGYALSTDNNYIAINGSGFAIGSTGTKIYVNGTQLTTAASTVAPFNGWRITYSSGATASSVITLTIPSGATVGDYTISARNIGSPTEPTALLKVVDKDGVIVPSLTAQSSSQFIPTLTSNSNVYYVYPPTSTPLTATLTLTNEGGMPVTTPLPAYTTVISPSATITSDSCVGKQLFMPHDTCSVSFTSTSPASNGNAHQLSHYGIYSPTYPKQVYIQAGPHGSAITAAAVTPLNGFTAPSVTTSEIDFGPLTSSATRTATITVKNTSSYAPQVFTPTISGNSAFTLSSTTCSSTPLAPNATCTASITLSSPTLQGPISATLTFGSDLQKASSIILKADSIDPPLSAGIDTTAMSNYFPMTSTISAVGTSQLDPITDSPPVFALTRYDNCSGSGTVPTLSLYQNNTPFHSNVPAHSTLDIQVTGGSYSCGIGYQNIDPNSTGRTLITGTTDFSISAWLGGGGSGRIYSQFQGTQPIASSPESKQTFDFYKDQLGRICFKYGNGTGITSGQTFCTTATAASATSWTHVAATKTGQTISLYVNGVGQSWTASVPLNFSIYSGASIGVMANQPITDIGIFQRTLTPTEITQIYSSKAPLIAK